jgi:hypothetical protein
LPPTLPAWHRSDALRERAPLQGRFDNDLLPALPLVRSLETPRLHTSLNAGSSSFENPDELSKYLGARLRACNLVCELDIDEGLHARAVTAMQALADRRIGDDAHALRWHRALVATYLVAEGVYQSVGRQFWPNLSVPYFTRASLGPVFEEALEVYGLEKFTTLMDAGARRYVARIYAHGGIPKYSLRDLFEVIVAAQRQGCGDAREIVAYWREHSSRIATVDSAIQRFFLYGGDVSLDFLDRCLDLVRSRPTTLEEATPERFGLPAYVCEGFVGLAPELKRIRDAGATSTVLPRPGVAIDPWDASGPTLLLPALTGDLRDGTWTVVGQGSGGSYPASRTDRLAPLAPTLHWQVEYRNGSGEVARAYTFPGLSRTGALLFDYHDGALASDPTRLRQPLVWILSPSGDDGVVLRGDGATLVPLEEAPDPAGVWDGYRLAAYDLTGVERLQIGRARAGAAAGARYFWVRIRSERIALDATPLAGIRTEAGVAVYDHVPALRLPGFGTGAGGSAWYARVVCDGVEHTHNGAALAERAGDILSGIVPRDRLSTVQLTVRGPLGMDLRASFAVVPGLLVERPDALLLPSRSNDDVLALVGVRGPDGRAVRLPVKSGCDAVTAVVRDGASREMMLLVTVPCLQWAFLGDGAERGDLAQDRLRIATGMVLDATLALLVVRTRKPGTLLALQVRIGTRVLQEIVANAAGEDGRWAFDLRRFSDTIRSTGEPLLSLVLVVGGVDVCLADVRADLVVSNLRVHQRVVPGYASVTLTWNEPRPLRNRVARLWSLSAPWRPAVSMPIPDDARGEVTISGSDDDITPGCYLAEIAVDDGWATPLRPRATAPTARQMRLGVEEDERHWLGRQRLRDPFTVLSIAMAGDGSAPRSLTPDEVEQVTPAALDAMVLLRDLQGDSVAEASVEALARLIVAVPDAMARGAVRAALQWGDNHESPFLRAAIELIPRLARSSAVHVPLSDTAALWELCPPLAAALDLPHHRVPAVRARIEQGLGIKLDALADCETVPPTAGRPPQLQLFAGMPLPHLVDLRRACSLLPKRPLDLDMQAAAHFEWLVADKEERFSASNWCTEQHRLLELTSELPTSLATLARAIRTPAHLVSAFPIMPFPELVHLAAWHLAAGSKRAARAGRALRPLLSVCPLLLNRALVLAVAQAHLSA